MLSIQSVTPTKVPLTCNEAGVTGSLLLVSKVSTEQRVIGSTPRTGDAFFRINPSHPTHPQGSQVRAAPVDISFAASESGAPGNHYQPARQRAGGEPGCATSEERPGAQRLQNAYGVTTRKYNHFANHAEETPVPCQALPGTGCPTPQPWPKAPLVDLVLPAPGVSWSIPGPHDRLHQKLRRRSVTGN